MLTDDDELPISRFLIIGNGRTGSTWFLTSLDRLPGVNARQELKWYPDDTLTFRSDSHGLVKKGSSMSRAIDAVAIDSEVNSRIRGSKFIFNPYRFYGPGVFTNLKDTLDPGIHLILLKRSYLDVWLSWKARGVHHELDPTVAVSGNNPLIEAIRGLQKPETINLVLHHGGRALSDAQGVAYPLATAVDDVLQLYVNDIQSIALLAGRPSLMIDYRDVGARFEEAASFIGSDVDSPAVAEILARPQTLKLPDLSNRLQPVLPISTLSKALESVVADVFAGSCTTAQALSWTSETSLEISEPRIVDALAVCGFEPTNGRITWDLLRVRLNE